MKKVFAKIMLLLFLMQMTQLGEVARLPLLWGHFMQHKTQYPATTVIGFIKMHYIDKAVVDADYAQDMQLPFKTPVHYNLGIPMSLPPEKIELGKLLNKSICLNPVPFTHKIPNRLSVSIFQPPKKIVLA